MDTSTREKRIVSGGKLLPKLDPLYIATGNFVLALTLVGYPLSASLSEFIDVENININIVFRLIHVALSILLISMTSLRKNFTIDNILLLFFVIYTIRMLWDISYSLSPNIEKDFQFFIVSTLIPVIAMSGSRKWYNERACIKYTIFIGALAGILILINVGFSGPQAGVVDLNQRASLERLNPISMAYHGLFIALAAVIFLSKYAELRTTIFVMPVALLGVYLLVISGSRGPFVALLAGLIITGLSTKSVNVTYGIAIVISVALIAYFGLPELISSRFSGSGQDESSLQRIDTLQLSIEQTLRHPFLGYAYIEPITDRYPHNLIAEAGMALGLAGVILLSWMQISMISNALIAGRNGQWFLSFLAGAMLANAWISGSLWGSVMFFVAFWLVKQHGQPGDGYRRF